MAGSDDSDNRTCTRPTGQGLDGDWGAGLGSVTPASAPAEARVLLAHETGHNNALTRGSENRAKKAENREKAKPMRDFFLSPLNAQSRIAHVRNLPLWAGCARGASSPPGWAIPRMRFPDGGGLSLASILL